MGKNFDAFFERAKMAADGAGKKATETWEVSKLKWQSIQLSGKIKEQYEKLGSAVYSMSKADYDNPELISSFIEQIDLLNSRLDEVNDKIAEVRKYIPCSCCGFHNAVSSLYCAHCGSRLFSKEEEVSHDFDPEESDFEAEQ